MENIKLADYTSPKSEAMVRASITRKIEELVHTYPKITIAQLMAFIFRSKGEVMGAPWNWSDSRTLKKLEDVQRQLTNEYDVSLGEFIDEPLS